MKKLLSCFVLICLLSACTSKTTPTYGFSKINATTLLDKISAQESFVVMITTDDCYACDEYKDKVNAVLQENKLSVYELYYDNDNDDTLNQLRALLGSYSSFPAVYNVEGGSTKSIYEYSRNPKGWKTWLQAQNLIQN